MADTSQTQPRQLASIDYFGKRAGRYRESHGDQNALAQLVRMANPQGDELVLDVGAGPGHLACAFAPHVRQAVASDVTLLMLKEASVVMRQREVPNLWRVAADAQALPFADGRFDIVTSRLAAAHFPDHRGAVSEMARVCKRGGIVLVADSMGPEDKAAQAYVDELEWLRDSSHGCNRSFTEWNAAYRAAGLEVEQVYVTCGRMHSLENWMARADTPPANRHRIYTLIENAPDSLREHIDIGRDGEGNLYFTTAQIRILGRKR